MLIEQWKDIKGYKGLYQVSNLGNVKSLDRIVHTKTGNQKWKSKVISKSIFGLYYGFNICKNGKKKKIHFHRLVAQAFLPNPNNKKEVNHINGDKLDNRVENLEWVTRQENAKHAYDTGLINVDFSFKRIYCVELDRYFKTIKSFCEYLKENGYYKNRSVKSIQTMIKTKYNNSFLYDIGLHIEYCSEHNIDTELLKYEEVK